MEKVQPTLVRADNHHRPFLHVDSILFISVTVAQVVSSIINKALE
jgi:hypothetical protein